HTGAGFPHPMKTVLPLLLAGAFILSQCLSAASTAPARATLGDSVVEPVWDRGLTVTVGPANADIVGTGARALQAAVDYIARTGNRFKLDQGLRKNFWRLNQTRVSTLFPLISGENLADIAIENIALDGNRANNENLDGNYAGCIFLQECNRVAIRDVTARNY